MDKETNENLEEQIANTSENIVEESEKAVLEPTVMQQPVVDNPSIVDEVKTNEETTDTNQNIAEPVNDNNKKNKGIIAVILVFILLIAASSAGLYLYLSKDKKVEDKEKEPEISNEILFTKDNMPRVDASLATQPLMDAFLDNFTGKDMKGLGMEYSNTHPGYVKLINNQADLIVVTEPSKEELELAKSKNIELEVTKVVNEGFVFFVNKNNKVNSISLENIRRIYSGEITNWSELGGDNAKIVAFQRPTNSGSQTGLLSLVMKDKKVKVPTTTEKIQTMSGIIEQVADYDNGINSIGYSYYYYAETMYKNDNLKYIAIDDVEPNMETIKNGTYPIRTAYYIVTRKGETNENVAKLKDAMLSKRGQLVAQKAGYVPVN